MPDTPRSARELVASVHQLISLPDIYLRVQALLNDPDSSLTEVAGVIAHDPGITTRLLRLVNSAHFGFRSKIDTVSRAVSILGLQQIHDIVLATSVIQTFAGMDNRVMSMDVYWRKSVYCGVVAHLLAIPCHVLDRERLFVAGLLRDLGHLVMYQRIPSLAQQALTLARERPAELHEVERELLGFDYAEVGGELMRDWGLPPSLVEPVTFHTDLSRAGGFPLETAIVHIAGRCAETSGGPPAGDGPDCGIAPRAWEVTGLSAEALEGVLLEAGQRLNGIVELLLPHGASSG